MQLMRIIRIGNAIKCEEFRILLISQPQAKYLVQLILFIDLFEKFVSN